LQLEVNRTVNGSHRGSWHQVWYISKAEHVLFRNRGEARLFLCSLAVSVRNGWLEVHGFCLLQTELHLLVKTPAGLLPAAMKSVCQRHDRACKRPGTVFRERCKSRLVFDAPARRDVLRHLENAPLHARVGVDPGRYPFASGFARCGVARLPPWLANDWVASEIGVRAGAAGFEAAYAATFLGKEAQDAHMRVEVVLCDKAQEGGVVEQLKQGQSAQVAQWLQWRARAKMGERSVPALCRAESVDALIQRRFPRRGGDRELVRLVLLREMCGMPWELLAQFTHQERWCVERLYGEHRWRLEAFPEHANELARMACELPLEPGAVASLRERSDLIPWEPVRPVVRQDKPQMPWRALRKRR
jgi:hypothetical protein